MKAAFLAVVLATVAPRHVTVGPVVVPVWWFLVLAEALAVAAGAWLTVWAVRRYRARRWPRVLYGTAL